MALERVSKIHPSLCYMFIYLIVYIGALTLRFVRDFFVDHWDPTIEDSYKKSIEVDCIPSHIQILDTAGQDDFESLRPQWMMDKDGYIFVYAMDRESSLRELDPFFELSEQINETRHIPIMLVANKKDLVVFA